MRPEYPNHLKSSPQLAPAGTGASGVRQLICPKGIKSLWSLPVSKSSALRTARFWLAPALRLLVLVFAVVACVSSNSSSIRHGTVR